MGLRGLKSDWVVIDEANDISDPTLQRIHATLDATFSPFIGQRDTAETRARIVSEANRFQDGWNRSGLPDHMIMSASQWDKLKDLEQPKNNEVRDLRNKIEDLKKELSFQTRARREDAERHREEIDYYKMLTMEN